MRCIALLVLLQGFAASASSGQPPSQATPVNGDRQMELVKGHGVALMAENGMMNTLDQAARNALTQTGRSVSYLHYNPKDGFFTDLVESFVQKISPTSKLGNDLANLLVETNGKWNLISAATQVGGYDRFFDLVGNVIGLNSWNPFRFAGSLVAGPSLATSVSPHSTYRP